MKNNRKDNVLNFAQSETKTKTFRNDYPINEELRQSMVFKFGRDIMKFTKELYSDDYDPLLKEYVEDHQVRGEKKKELMENLFYWRLLYDTSNDPSLDFVEHYINENFLLLRKTPLIISWLREWKKAVPKFYYVGHKTVDCSFVVIDMLEEKPVEVIMYDPFTKMPENGEIVLGTLLPLGDDLYFPVTEFYRFDYEAREFIARTLLHHHEKYKKETSTIYEAFIHVLSVMLQIEHRIYLEHHELSPS